MFWDKKKKEGLLPDLPPANHKFMEDNLESERNALPSFPDSPTSKGFSQSAIKDAIGDSDRDNDGSDFDSPMDSTNVSSTTNERSFKTVEMEEWSPESDESGFRSNIPSIVEETDNNLIRSKKENNFGYSKISNPEKTGIFVKISKFHLAKKSLKEIQGTLEDIENLLQKIKEVRTKEESELSTWEKDIHQVKSRVHSVTEDIFEDIEWVQNS